MRKFLVALLVSVIACTVGAQTLSTRETITLGVDLTLGMTEDAVVKQLTESGYKARKRELSDAMKQKGFTSMWFIDDRGDEKYTPSLGVILFSQGRLSSAMRELLPDGGNQVEFGRQLYFAMRDLESEGNSHCTIETETSEVPDFAQKSARLHCGKKTIVVILQKQQNKNESVSLNEEIAVRPIK